MFAKNSMATTKTTMKAIAKAFIKVSASNATARSKPASFAVFRALLAGLVVGLTVAVAVASTPDEEVPNDDQPFVIVLGIAQDGGYPQAGCQKDCCRELLEQATGSVEGTSCLAIVDPVSGQRWLFECTPNFPAQLQKLNSAFPVDNSPGIDGIFLTHAHIGHYAGLIHLGREVMGTRDIPVHTMPRMNEFLKNNGPWSQLVELNNIDLKLMQDGKSIRLNERLSVTPITVPHRDEFSETVAFKITGPEKSVLFLPDIDKWSRWETSVEDVIREVDFAYLDASFFDGTELPERDMSEIPHPFIVESIERFGSLPADQRSKIRFIHLNHTNPALRADSKAAAQIQQAGMSVAKTLEKHGL